QTYVVSYYTPSGHYASTENYFTSPVLSPPFSTVVDDTGGSGVYHYGPGGGFPDQTWPASNYWVEPGFTTATGLGPRPPTLPLPRPPPPSAPPAPLTPSA